MHSAKKPALCALLCMLSTLRPGLSAQEKKHTPIRPAGAAAMRGDQTQPHGIKTYATQIPPGTALKPELHTRQKKAPATRAITIPNRAPQEGAITAHKRLSPTKAGLYSTVLPGLGQAYNRKYWKIPIAYALMATSSYFIKYHNDKYRRMRNAFITRINGGEDEFDGILSVEQIADRATEYERDRNIAMLFTIGFYILNVVDAVVDAHLSEFNVDKDLSLAPLLIKNPGGRTRKPGIAMRFRF